jgi:Cdc6-like AAA superfamily ATPase
MSSTISSESIVRQLKTCFMRLPHVDRIHGRLSDLAGYVCGAEEPDHLLVIGETGTGKSTLLIRFAAGFGRIEHKSFTEIPVLYAQVPSRCTIKRLATILLRQMGSPFYNRGDEEDRTHQLITLLRACKVRVIILDEVNHLIDRGGRITHYAVGDWIKQTFDLASVSCVLAGTPRSTLLLDTNEQMADRFREIVKLPTFSIETPEETKDLQRMLKAFRKQLGDLPSVDFSGGTLPAQILFATGGRFRDVKRLLSRAVEIAFQEDAPALRTECFARAFSEVIFVDAETKRNPFLPEFNGLPLTQPGEPFAKPRA